MTNDTNTPVANGEIPNTTDPKPEIGKTSGTGEIPGTTTPQLTIDDALKEIDRLKADLKKVHSESAGHRNKAKELDDLKAKLEADKLSETEKLQKQLATLQSEHDNAIRAAQERTINYEVRLQAAQMGIVDPDAAAKLLDWSQIEYDDNGAPTNVNDLLKNLLKTKSYLAGKAQVQTSGGATNPSRSTTTAPQTLSWEVIGNMKPDEYNARRAEIQQWIATHPHRFGQRI